MTTSVKDVSRCIQELAERFASHFPERLKSARWIGREAEYPVVTSTGDAADVQKLWPLLEEQGEFTRWMEGDSLVVGLKGSDFDVSLEVGWGTIELITRPCRDLHELQEVQERAMKMLLHATDALDYHVLGFGIQPKTPGSLALMSPKARYQLLYERIGQPWLWFTSTASDQVHLDLCAGEVIDLLNFGNLMAPVVIALCANSSVYGGEYHGFYSSREGEMGQISAEEHRHGMPGRPVTSLVEWLEDISHHAFFLRKLDGDYHVQEGTFFDFLAREGADFSALLDHDHYIWNSARVRTAHATVELRAACQQPWSEHMVNSALGLGLIEAGATLYPWLRDQLGESYWSVMREYHHRVIREGLAAKEPFDGMLRGILERCEQGLERRGKGEAFFLKPLWQRLESGKNPGQRALQCFQEDGMMGLLSWLRISDGASGNSK